MPTLSVRLPDSIHREVRQLAKEDGVSINQFISLALAEKVSSLRTVDYLSRGPLVARQRTCSPFWIQLLTLSPRGATIIRRDFKDRAGS